MAGISFLINRSLLRTLGPAVIISVSPAVEEAVKTLPAYFLGVDILLTHVIFGLLEAVYDGRRGKTGWLAALSSVSGHGLFGLATVTMQHLTGAVAWGLIAAWLLHTGWNALAVRKEAKRQGKKE